MTLVDQDNTWPGQTLNLESDSANHMPVHLKRHTHLHTSTHNLLEKKLNPFKSWEKVVNSKRKKEGKLEP